MPFQPAVPFAFGRPAISAPSRLAVALSRGLRGGPGKPDSERLAGDPRPAVDPDGANARLVPSRAGGASVESEASGQAFANRTPAPFFP
jgi:hypothetical protein